MTAGSSKKSRFFWEWFLLTRIAKGEHTLSVSVGPQVMFPAEAALLENKMLKNKKTKKNIPSNSELSGDLQLLISNH